MKQLQLLAFVLAVVIVAATQQSSPSTDNPSVKVSFPNTSLNATATNICAVDFQNIRLVRDSESVKLKRGKYDHQEKTGGFESVSIDGVHCFAVQQGIPQYAVVKSTWSYGYGSSNNECIVQVVTLRSGQPVVAQQFDFDCHALTTGAKFDVKTNRLTVRARTSDDSPHCCAKSLDVVTYTWRGDKFERSEYHRIHAVVEKGSGGMERH